MSCIKILSYIIPYFGNRRILPYGKMEVEYNGERKTVKFGDVDSCGTFFIVFNRKRFYFRNVGGLYSPIFQFD